MAKTDLYNLVRTNSESNQWWLSCKQVRTMVNTIIEAIIIIIEAIIITTGI